ncbi:MAG: iron chaperone [Ignavibacteria bacterium]
MAKKAKTVDEYLEQLNNPTRKTLGQVRKVINSAAPKAEEKIAYGIPYYKYNGAFMAFTAHKNHCSLVTMSYDIVSDLKDELKPYKISGTTIQFPHDKALPAQLVTKIVKARINEKETKQKP